MIKVGSILGEVNPRLTVLLKLRSRWSEITGDLLASHTTPVSISRNNLLVQCDSPAWIQQVGLLESELKDRIEEIADIKVEGIKAKLKVHSKRDAETYQWHRIEIPEVSMDESLIKDIKDPELKHAVLEFMETSRRRNA